MEKLDSTKIGVPGGSTLIETVSIQAKAVLSNIDLHLFWYPCCGYGLNNGISSTQCDLMIFRPIILQPQQTDVWMFLHRTTYKDLQNLYALLGYQMHRFGPAHFHESRRSKPL